MGSPKGAGWNPDQAEPEGAAAKVQLSVRSAVLVDWGSPKGEGEPLPSEAKVQCSPEGVLTLPPAKAGPPTLMVDSCLMMRILVCFLITQSGELSPPRR